VVRAASLFIARIKLGDLIRSAGAVARGESIVVMAADGGSAAHAPVPPVDDPAAATQGSMPEAIR